MPNTLSIRYGVCACAKGVLCYLEPSVVFKAKVGRHVRIQFNYPTIPVNMAKKRYRIPNGQSQKDNSETLAT